MELGNREDCSHAHVCKYDDAMCPMECGHYENFAPELEKAAKWDEIFHLIKGNCNLCKCISYCEKNDVHPCEILKDALEGDKP